MFFRCVFISIFLFFIAESPGGSSAHLPKKKLSTHELIRQLLDQELSARKFSFSDVVFATSGKKVLPIRPENSAHQVILQAVERAAREATVAFSDPHSSIQKLRRINEASRYFEDFLRQKLNEHPSLTCTVPKNTQGQAQRSGYPDLLITYKASDGSLTYAYLDPKLFEEKSRSSSLRTFYFEPRSQTNKIQYDAIHILLGISHDGKVQAWTFTGWEICDLSRFQVRLKAEFQASNKELYRAPVIIKSSK